MTFKNLQCSWIVRAKAPQVKESQLRGHSQDVWRLTGAVRMPVHNVSRNTQEAQRQSSVLPGSQDRGPGAQGPPSSPGLASDTGTTARLKACALHTPFHPLGALSLFQKPLVGQAHELRWAGRWAQLKPQGPLLPLRPFDSPAHGHLHRPN